VRAVWSAGRVARCARRTQDAWRDAGADLRRVFATFVTYRHSCNQLIGE